MSKPANTEARRRVIAARTALVLDEPFFGTLALRLALKEDASQKTAWVDGQTLGYNPEFVMSLPTAQVKSLLVHEVMHCAMGHPWRKAWRDHRRWNEACDRAINPALREAGYELPACGLMELEPTHTGKSAEWIYDRLPQPPQQQPGGGGQGHGGGGGQTGMSSNTGEQSAPPEDEGSPEGQPSPQEDEGDSSVQGQGSGPERPGNDPARPQGGPDPQDQGSEPGQASESPDGPFPLDSERVSEGHTEPDPFGEVRDAPQGGTGESEGDMPTEVEWQMAVQQAAALAQAQGSLPAGMERFVQDATKPRVDWRSAMRRFAQEVARSDYSWTRPSVRHMMHGLYVPSLRSEEVGVIAVAIDTSGSIDSVLLNQFGAELRAIADEVKPRQVRVLYCDSAVHRWDVFERGDPIELHACGGGGTDFRPVFNEIGHWDEPPVCVVYLTDLWGTFPEREPEWPVLWVTGKDDAHVPRVPFGDVVSATY